MKKAIEYKLNPARMTKAVEHKPGLPTKAVEYKPGLPTKAAEYLPGVIKKAKYKKRLEKSLFDIISDKYKEKFPDELGGE